MSIRRSENHELGVAFVTADNKIKIDLGGGHGYYAVHYRDGIFAVYKHTDCFVAFYPYEVLIDPAAMKAFAPGSAYMDGYWTTERCIIVRDLILSYMPKAPEQITEAMHMIDTVEVAPDILIEAETEPEWPEFSRPVHGREWVESQGIL